MSVSFGAVVSFGGTAIGNLIDVAGSGLSAGVVDTSNQGLPATSGVAYKTFDFSGLVDPGEITLKVQTDGTIPAVGSIGTLSVKWSTTGATWSCANSILQSYDPTANMGTEMVASLKFKLSGAPTVSAGSGS